MYYDYGRDGWMNEAYGGASFGYEMVTTIIDDLLGYLRFGEALAAEPHGRWGYDG
jgi:hypothetical protein